MSSITLLIFCFPGITFACGSIYSPEVPWYDAVGEYDRKIIDDCANPFGRTQADFPGDISVIVDGVTMTADGVFTIATTGTENHRVTYGNYPGLEIGWFLHTERGYEFIKTSPSTPTRDDIEALAGAFFAPEVNYAHFVSEVLGEEPGIDYDDDAERTLLREFYQYIEAEYKPITPTLMPGTYTVVVVESYVFPVEVPRPWYLEWLIPEAYAAVPVGDNTYTLTFTLAAEVIPEEPTGASSVLFLPGIQASRLYKTGVLGTEDQLWEPNTNQDVRQLAMTEAGESVEDIYTKDVIDEALGVVGVYNDFGLFLDELVATGTIAGWEPFAYDWRYSVFSVVEDGTLYQPGRRSLKTTVTELVEDSYSGKVTIVAHSNGGLLAKALLITYPELAAIIDRIIFLGTPQLGTPTAIAALLHGYDQAKLNGMLVSAATARFATQNMPGAYGLLPGQAYFDEQEDLVITFDASDETKIFRDRYGAALNFESELVDFLNGAEGRSESLRVSAASIANRTLVDEVFGYRSELLDSWVAPDEIEIIEIVGVGLDTESGFEYTKFSERVCSEPDVFGSRTCEVETFYKPVPWISQYGDETVMAVSAEGYKGDKETYYVDLFETKNKHANLTELTSVQELVNNFISKNEDYDIPLITTVKPTYSTKRAMISTHSPVTLILTDTEGNQTGVINGRVVEDIPGSSYRMLADSTYITLPEGVTYDVLIEAYDDGGMTFMTHLLDGDEQSMILTLPINEIASTTVIKTKNNGVAATSSFANFLIDLNGDGTTDTTMTPTGEVVSPEIADYTDLESAIQSANLRRVEKVALLALSRLAERMSERNNQTAKRLERQFLFQLEQALKLLKRKGRIKEGEYSDILSIITQISNK